MRSPLIRRLDVALLVVPAATLVGLLAPFARQLSPAWAFALAVASLAAWAVWLRHGGRPDRESRVIGVGLVLAVVALGWGSARTVRDFAALRASDRASAEVAYGAYWRELELRADGVARDLAAEPRALESPTRLFTVLERGTLPARLDGLALLLVRADGEVLAWGGQGLLREPLPGEGLASGSFARQSHAAATAWVVRPLRPPGAPGGAIWIVAGESRALSSPPPLLGEGGLDPRRWRFTSSTGETDWIEIAVPHRPALWLGPRRFGEAGTLPRLAALRAAALFAGLGLLGVAALRGLALGVLSGTVLRRRAAFAEVALLLVAAAASIAAYFDVSGRILGAFAAAMALALAALRDPIDKSAPMERDAPRQRGAARQRGGTRRRLRRAWIALPLAAAAAIIALALRAPDTWPDLAESATFDPAASVLRLTFAFLLMAALAWARRGRNGAPSTPFLVAAASLLVVAAAVHDRGWPALVVLALGLLAAVRGLGRAGWREPFYLVVLVLIGIAGSAVAWQWGVRARLAAELPELLEALTPPSEEVLAIADRRQERHFRAFDLANVAPGGLPQLDPADLAYSLWRESPLARLDAASAVVVEPLEGGTSSFSFGYPLDDAHEPDSSPARWESVAPTAWRALERRGEGALVDFGREVGRIRWYLVPRPGFGVRDAEIRDLPTTLLGARRSSDLAATRALALPAESGVAIVVYGPDGEIELSPWREGTPALARLRALRVEGASRIESPGGEARFALREAPGTTMALLLPRLTPARALERAGTQAAGALFVLALSLALGALLALPRATARDLVGRVFRSYAKRLILVYSLLLLAPLVLLYALLSESLGQRLLREQRAAAEAALSSVQRVLGEYVLELEPGFGLDTALDDDLLVWLSRVVGYEIHLYWNGELYASSQPELFAAGFLPRRVPGEVWRGTAWLGERLMTRTTHAGEARYVELYAPLLVPGIDPRAARLLLSMPLLAQQEEAQAETARIRRRTMLATLAAFLLLAAFGVRLARSFTRPITDLVAGTRRIAAGSPALGVALEVDELSALGEAIDQMARRIAEGRAQLVREKQLVEGIVDSVTSGVVGVDRSGRVLLANRVARQLLDVEPGERLAERLALRPELDEVRAFVTAAAGHDAPSTARAMLTTREDRDWSLVWLPLAGAEEAGGLLVVEDVSEVLRAQRLEAWAAMARLIAHEIKNPLTPIRLSTEHLRDAWQRDRAHFESVFDRCTTNILRQVDELREIASEFSVYSHIPKSERMPGDLVATLREVVEGYDVAPPPGVVVRFEPGAPSLAARFDARLLGRAVRNLLENALRVSREGGLIRVELDELPESDSVRIRVSDDGPGVPDELLAKIFEPYFSTQSGGTGLGLPIALRIVEEHGGSIRARNRVTGGLEVTITMPRE